MRPVRHVRRRLLSVAGSLLIVAGLLPVAAIAPVAADNTSQALPSTQNWANAGLITANDDWSGVPGIVGHLGQDITTATGVDPQTLLTVSAVANDIDVIANQTNPNTLATGGVAEFAITDPAVALQGSGTADAPYLLLALNSSGLSGITVAYNLRDIDGSTDNSIQPVALQYRVGSSGNFTNVPAGFVSDASTGPSLATQTTAVSATLPAAANDQPLVQVRVITSNAVGNDEWIGVDDISVTGTDLAPTVSSTATTDGATGVAVGTDITVTFSEPVTLGGLTDEWVINCPASASHAFVRSGGPTTFTLNPTTDLPYGNLCSLSINGGGVSDQDTNDPPDQMADFAFIFMTEDPPVDLPPWVDSTTPADGATGVTLGSDVTITFREPVTATGSWHTISCATSGSHTATASGGPTTFTLNPGTNFVHSELCTVTVVAAQVADQDGTADNMAVDYVFSFTTEADAAPTVSSTTPANGATGVAVGSNITVTFSEPVTLGGFGDMWFIACPGLPFHPFVRSGGPTTFNVDPTGDLPYSQSCSVSINGGGVTDQDGEPDQMLDYSFSFMTEAPPPRIHDIQGASHTGAILGPVSNVFGIVTAKRSNGFYMQDPVAFWDANDATSEAIFVFTSSAPTGVNVGDALQLAGTVVEFRPGGATSTNLTLTEITNAQWAVLSTGNPLPPTTVIGVGGRVPPTTVIEDDTAGAPPQSVETSGVFDPASDGIDFYESLEAMLVQVNNPVVVGPRNNFGEVFVLADNGAGASVRTARGGIVVRASDFNPERIQLDDALLAGSTPNASVGDHFTMAVGILDYDFGNFEVNLTAALTTIPGGLAREITPAPAANELSVATFNVENLDALEPVSKFNALAGQIVTNLRAPDVIALEEIQDNNGATNDSVVDASATLDKLVTAITAAGGPSYAYRLINPVDDQDGGEPGGNIRVGFLFRTDRGLAFVDRAGGGPTTATTIDNVAGNPQLSSSPGRVDPTNAAWNSSRKPLAGEFTYRGQTIFMIANHLNSKGGDQPLFGRFQPPARSSEVQRHQQAQILNNFVDAILAVDANAKVVVIGDINDFEFSQTVTILKGGVLNDLMDTLPANERYSYVFEGNSQTLDHILISNSMVAATVFDAVHINSEFHDQLSDHDPSVMRYAVAAAPGPTPTPTPTPVPTPTPSASPSQSSSPSPSSSASASPTAEPTLPPTDATDSSGDGGSGSGSLWMVLIALLALMAGTVVATPTRLLPARRTRRR